MEARGRKHICKVCKRPYFDLGKKAHSCPRCKANDKRKASTVKATSHQKSDKPKDISTEIELFEIVDPSLGKANSISSGTLKIEFPAIKPGWYAVISSEIKDKKVANKNAIIYLREAPLIGLEKHLSSIIFKGVGAVTAKTIISQNRENALTALQNSSPFIEKELGVKKEIAQSLKEGWEASPTKNIFTILMHELGLMQMQVNEIENKYGADIIASLNQNPFSLVKTLPRFSFQDVDRVCKRLEIEVTEEQRILAATDYYLGDAERRLRHTCLPELNAHQRVGELLLIDANRVSDALEKNKDAFVYSNRRNKTVISTAASASRDNKITQELKSIIDKHKPISKGMIFDGDNIETSEGIQLSEEQINAINNVVNAPIAVITGGPGSGKTTMVQGLVSALKTLKADARLCAPTGRAAKRISETPGLAELGPSTIHMFLAKERGTKKPSEFDVMIVDEASMIDVELMVELLEAIPKGTSIIFIGDVDQLPPVGPGQPFKDLIESDMVSVSRLTGNFRQASFSDTVKAARSVIRGLTPPLTDALAKSDFVFIETAPENQAETVLNLYFDLMPEKLRVQSQDIQILSPQRPGEVGVLRLNDLIQYRLTGKTKPIFKKKSGNHEITFFIGDKVIQRKNNYELKVMNGDQGVITRESGQDLMVEFDGVEIAYDGLQRFDLDLAYATTIHSSQGSEYPGVIIPVVSSHAHMLSRNLIYTAITRGKAQVCIVGEIKALEKALTQYQKDFRWTCLTEILQEKLN